jgi:hypothetical protein
MEDLIYSVSLLFGILIVLLIIIYYDLLININKNKDKSKEDDDDETIIEKYCDSGGACGACRADDNLKEQDMPAKNIIMTSEDIKVGDENYKHIIYEKDIVDKYKIPLTRYHKRNQMATVSSFYSLYQ